MKTIFLLLAVFFMRVLLARSEEIQSNLNLPDIVVTNFLGSKADWIFSQSTTNGLIYGITSPSVMRRHPNEKWGAIVISLATNNDHSVFMGQSSESCLDLNLFDPNGNPVKKTALGKTFGNPVVQATLEKAFWEKGGRIMFSLHHPYPVKLFTVPGVSQLFVLKEPGEYTLHVKMRLIKNSGNVSGHPQFQQIWLPEIIVKIETRPEDISTENLPSSVQTNSPAK
jgi:hypothetical protein